MTNSILPLNNILSQLRMDGDIERWEDGWAYSADRIHDVDLVLENRFIEAQCRALNLAEEVTRAILEGLPLFDRVPLLKQLFKHAHITGFKSNFPTHSAFRWSKIPTDLDRAAPLFYVYVFLSGVPTVMAYNRQHGIPDEVVIDTLRELEFWILDERKKENRWGLNYNQVNWLGLHFSGELYQLGRLQFQFSRYYYHFKSYRHRKTGRIIVLAGDNMMFRKDGQFDGANGITETDVWKAEITDTGKSTTGFPIHPHGYALSKPITLHLDEWALVLQNNDPTLAVHILGTGPMDFEECGASFARAPGFWAKHFPDYHFRAYTCSSWLLDQQFEHILNPNSNIVQFLREWYLTPVENASDRESLRRVFGVSNAGLEDIINLPRRTSLQQAVIPFMESGGRLRYAAGIIYPHNMRWGDQVYRRDVVSRLS